MNEFLIEKAFEFASEKHKEQKRKYTNEPYIVHPVNVAKIIEEAFSSTPELYIYSDKLNMRFITKACALLHDTVEDTDTTFNEIEETFGIHIRNILYYVTNISKQSDGNRKIRKEIDMVHNLEGPLESIMIKLADIIDNCDGIMKRDSSFGKKYLIEKQQFLLNLVSKGKYNNFKETIDRPLFEVLEYLYNKAWSIIKNEINTQIRI